MDRGVKRYDFVENNNITNQTRDSWHTIITIIRLSFRTNDVPTSNISVCVRTEPVGAAAVRESNTRDRLRNNNGAREIK